LCSLEQYTIQQHPAAAAGLFSPFFEPPNLRLISFSRGRKKERNSFQRGFWIAKCLFLLSVFVFILDTLSEMMYRYIIL